MKKEKKFAPSSANEIEYILALQEKNEELQEKVAILAEEVGDLVEENNDLRHELDALQEHD